MQSSHSNSRRCFGIARAMHSKTPVVEGSCLPPPSGGGVSQLSSHSAGFSRGLSLGLILLAFGAICGTYGSDDPKPPIDREFKIETQPAGFPEKSAFEAKKLFA